MTSQEPITFYGCPVSLYSGKVRSFLRKSGTPYSERLQSHPDYLGRIMPTVGRFVIPVIETAAGDIIQDTTEIIDFLENRAAKPFSVYPEGAKQRIIALILEAFGDEGLLRAAMHYRWNFPEQNKHFIAMEFGRTANPTATTAEALEFATPGMTKMQAYLPGLGVTPETIPAIEQSYTDLLAALDGHLLTHPYLLGGKPTIGDFGLYGPMYAHLARDPAPEMLMKTTANRVWRWVERMTASDMDKPEFPDLPDTTTQDDTIPETLLPVLQLIGQDYGPEVEALTSFINDYLDQNSDIESGKPVIADTNKRVLGGCSFKLRDTQMSVGARHYSLWMLQRIHDAYDALSAHDKAETDTLLKSVNLDMFVTCRTSRRIARRGYKEVWE
ncbi:glutathione S-transferase family protein [Kordiimonas aquimaris]|uniref:glutathione S-transferase family protein n=1 Tax=Kordiimonas aquimaris TaxID=707591 RepID=UPI0021D3E17A|nr:glutathione S-transferase family protein [Kordiimonas aquimaris]